MTLPYMTSDLAIPRSGAAVTQESLFCMPIGHDGIDITFTTASVAVAAPDGSGTGNTWPTNIVVTVSLYAGHAGADDFPTNVISFPVILMPAGGAVRFTPSLRNIAHIRRVLVSITAAGDGVAPDPQPGEGTINRMIQWKVSSALWLGVAALGRTVYAP